MWHWAFFQHAYNSYHRLHGSASPVLTATGFVNGKGQFSTPHRIDIPKPITKKFVTGDYDSNSVGFFSMYRSLGCNGTAM